MVHSKIQPVGDRILVQFDPESEQTRRGVIIPNSAKEISQEATVIAVGSGRRSMDGTPIPFEVQIGDRVLLAKYTGAEVRLEDLKYTLVREEDILGRIK